MFNYLLETQHSKYISIKSFFINAIWIFTIFNNSAFAILSLNPGEALYPSEYLCSENKAYMAKFELDGNFCIYQNEQSAIWCTETQISGDLNEPAVLLNSNGELAIYGDASNLNQPQQKTWSNTQHINFNGSLIDSKDYKLILQNNRNLVVTHKGEIVWQSNTSTLDIPTDTLNACSIADTAISRNEVLFLGIDAAGWYDYSNELVKRNLSETNYMLPKNNQSIYKKHHDETFIRSEAVNSWSEFSPLEQKHFVHDYHYELYRIIESIDMLGVTNLNSHKAIMNIVKKKFELENSSFNLTRISDVAKKINEQDILKLIGYLYNLSKLSVKDLDGFDNAEVARLKCSNGYNYLNCLQPSFTYMSYSPIMSSINTLYFSKSLVVDTLQENIYRYYNNQPLVPTIVLVEREDYSNQDNNFKANSQEIITDANQFFTSAEIRMIYMLMEEVDDPVISSIARQTTSLIQVNVDAFGKVYFKKIPNYWDQDPDSWQYRYRDHFDDQNPEWLKELINYRKQLALHNG